MLGQLGNDGGIEAEVVAFHNARKAPILLCAAHSGVTAHPLIRHRLVGGNAKVPGSAARVCHGVQANAAAVGRLCLAGKINARALKAQRVVAALGLGIAAGKKLVHFKGDEQGNIRGERLNQLDALFLGAPAEVVGPKHDVGIGLNVADGAL